MVSEYLKYCHGYSILKHRKTNSAENNLFYHFLSVKISFERRFYCQAETALLVPDNINRTELCAYAPQSSKGKDQGSEGEPCFFYYGWGSIQGDSELMAKL